MKHAYAEIGAAASSELKVTELTRANRDRWDSFVHSSSHTSFFHLSAWKWLIEDIFNHRTAFLMAERGGAVVGVLPLAQMRSVLFGNSLVSLPFAVYGGIASNDDVATTVLYEAALSIAKQRGVDFLEMRNRARTRPELPVQDLYVTFRKEIASDPEENLAAIPRKQRAMVRKGIKFGLRSDLDDDTDRFFQLYSDNVHRHGTPGFSRDYFRALKREFGSACEVMTVVDANGLAVSGVMSFYFKDEVLPYYAGDLQQARDLAANDFKYWELLRRASERGIRIFDYGRSKRGTGSFDFKKNWGFEPTPLYYEYNLLKRNSIPQNNPSNPKYQTVIAMWRKMPRPLVNVLGPRISRYLG